MIVHLRRLRPWFLSVAIAIVIAAITCVYVLNHQSTTQDGLVVGSPVTVVGEDHLPSATAQDWVTYADTVVAVTATAEQDQPPSATEIKRGEGLVGRTVTLHVDGVLWQRSGGTRPTSDVDVSAYGWEFSGDTNHRRPMVSEDQPRLDVGHRYVMALRWESAPCTSGPDEDATVDRWAGLGSGSTVPFDDGVLGNGEVAGRTRSAQDALDELNGRTLPLTLAQSLIGKGADALVDRLSSAEPDPDPDFDLPTPRCD